MTTDSGNRAVYLRLRNTNLEVIRNLINKVKRNIATSNPPTFDIFDYNNDRKIATLNDVATKLKDVKKSDKLNSDSNDTIDSAVNMINTLINKLCV